MKALYFASLMLFGLSLTGIPALMIYLQNRWDFLIWGAIILILGFFGAIAIDDAMVKIFDIPWEIYIGTTVITAFILVAGVSLQWR